ncbi:MAG: hypothetical protein Q8R16_03235 [bacterium]|nr:hypothetical protein [bacterium]
MDPHLSTPPEIEFTIEHKGGRRWTEEDRRALLQRLEAPDAEKPVVMRKPTTTKRRPRGRTRGS